MLIGLVDGDVHPAVAHDVAGVIEPADVTELGEDRDRGQLPDPVDTGRSAPAAGLLACERAQLLIERRECASMRVDHVQRDLELLTRGRGKRQARPATRGSSTVSRLRRCGHRGDRAPSASAAATPSADATADAGSGRGRADRGCAPAGSTTPGPGRSTTAHADAWRRPSRSSRASSCPSTRRLSRLGQMHLRPDQLRAPRRRTASRSSPPTRPPASCRRTAQGTARTLRTVRRHDPRAGDLTGARSRATPP